MSPCLGVSAVMPLRNEEINCVLMPALKHEGRKAQRHGGFIKGFYKMQNCIPGDLVSPCLVVSAVMSLRNEEIHCVLIPALKHEGKEARRFKNSVSMKCKIVSLVTWCPPVLVFQALCLYGTKKYILF